MSDVLLTIHLPEALVAKAKAANLELESFIIQSLERDLHDITVEGQPARESTFGHLPLPDEIEVAIQDSLQWVASGQAPLRQLGLHPGSVWISDDFDDELPAEFWGDLFN